MFIAEYSHDKSYFNFEIPGILPEEGLLKGIEGELRFRRVHDGLAIYDTTLLNSGFVYPGSVDDVYVPHTINAIPITELHQTIHLKSRNTFSIENGNLKRVFFSIGKQSLNEQIEHNDNDLGTLLLYLLREKENANQKENSTEIEFSFCGNNNPQVEFCSIKCDDPVVLHMPAAKKVEVIAHKTELRGIIPNCVEHIVFSGKVYPFSEHGWDREEPNNHCFENLKNLKTIDGSLSGKNGWSFCNCTFLQSVHLSNGIKIIPAYAFSNCCSLRDLYIPDTVSFIEEYAFSGCENLISIHLPTNLKKISKGMFQNCKSLKKVFLSNTIEVIEDYAFSGCENLRKPWIPKSIKLIADTAFTVAE